MPKVKIIIVSNIMGLGGAERTVQTLALHIDKEFFDVRILCLEAGGPRVTMLEQAGIKVMVGDGTLKKIKELIPIPDVDILHFHRSGHAEPLHQAVIDYLQPKKIMETNVFAFVDPTLHNRFDLQIYKSIMMLTQRVWDGRVPQADAWLKQRVIYNPVTIDYFKQFTLDTEQRKKERLTYGIQNHDIVVGRMGRNDVVKWGDLILGALPYLSSRFPNLKFLFRTMPDSRQAWVRKNGFQDRVIVLPETTSEAEIAKTYQMFDMYVHTSRRGEAFGNTLNEAMVWGLPIVVENTPHWDNGQVEQVDHGKTGYLVQSVGGLCAAISDLILNKERRDAFGQAGYEKVMREFGVERGMAQYQLAYRQLMGIEDSNHVAKELFPTVETIQSFPTMYIKLKDIDMPHQSMREREIAYHFRRIIWRIQDSLKARGIIGSV